MIPILLAALLTASAVTASPAATPKVRDLPKSAAVLHLGTGTTYQREPHRSESQLHAGRGRLGRRAVRQPPGRQGSLRDAGRSSGRTRDTNSTSSPGQRWCCLRRTRWRAHSHDTSIFAPYEPPTSVKRWMVAGRQALYFDATAPPPGEWTLVGANPPELRIDHDNSFRMAALTVRGKTVVIVIHGPASDFKQFLPIGTRLVASLRFPVK